MNRRTKNIICIEQSSNDNNFLTNSAKNYHREIRVDSVSDMVNKVIRKLRGRLIQNLYIIGHGASGYQSIGNGNQIFLTNGKSLALRNDKFLLHGENVEKQIERLKTLFAPHGKLVLGGCRVAAESSGKGLLMRVSILLGNIPVEGSEDTQYPKSGIEGTVIRCIGKTVCTTNAKGICTDDFE